MLCTVVFQMQALACTGFMASSTDGVTLVGNNEDISLLVEPLLIVSPPSTNSYGRVEFYCKWPFPFDTASYSSFGGMNDQGLFFDIYSTPFLKPTNPLNKPTYNQDIFAYCIRTCATVDEVVDVFNSYYIPYMDEIQGFFVDRAGNSVIIEGDEVIYRQGTYQVVTNFLQSHPSLGGYPCWRYSTATSLLENMTDLSVEYFRDISKAVHMDAIPLQEFTRDTIYSNICDLTQGIMYIYFFHDYDHVIEIHLPEIFEQGYQRYELPLLFSNDSNHAPNKPHSITGQISGRIGHAYEYSAIGTDVDDDLLFHYFDWGDGTNSGWIGYHRSGEPCIASHEWSEQGSYELRVKTKDIYGIQSEWSDPLPIRMPHHIYSYLFLERNCPLLFKLLSSY